MAYKGRIRGIIIASVILIVGIIHLGVGIGIVAKYRKFNDIFQQQVSLSGYNIFIGLCTIAIGILGLVSILTRSIFLKKILAIATFVLGIFTLGSLIAALAISGTTASYLRDSITDNMNSYAEDDDAMALIDNLQTTYECCGVNLWLDWARVSLGAANGITYGRRRRRRDSSPPPSPLTRALRGKRQSIIGGGTIYNLPTTYTINLPLSCCENGGTTIVNSVGGYCVFNPNNGSSSFFLRGCLVPVANIGFSQITGIAVINTCLTILTFVTCGMLIHLFRTIAEPENSKNNQPSQNGTYQGQQIQQQEQQYPYEQYYVNNYYTNPYYTYTYPMYKTYM